MPDARTITVQATGRAALQPDVAVAVIGVFARADGPGAALRSCSDRLQRVVETLRANPAVERLSTGSLEVQQHVEHRGERPPERSYQASSSLSVEVRPPRAIGEVVAAAVDTDDEGIVVSGLRFATADEAAARSAARRDAVGAAVAAAGELAEAAGVRLGAVQSIQEGAAAGRLPTPLRAARAVAAGPPVEVGEQEVAVTVTAEFSIEPA